MAEDSIESVLHPTFKYVFIPRDVGDPVEVREFEGREKDFKALLNNEFQRDVMMQSEKKELTKTLMSQKGVSDVVQVTKAVELSQSVEIVSLTLPKPSNNYEAVNAYIDNVGRVKGLPKNTRASRITSTDIRGDCYISKTFDDDVTFKRIDYTMEDYNMMLEDPPSAANRWNSSQAMLQLQKEMQESNAARIADAAKPSGGGPQQCRQCHKQNSEELKLKKCSRCHKVS